MTREPWKRWTFELRDSARNKWVVVGDTRAATANAWSALHFTVSGDFAPYVSSSRQIQVRYSTATKKLASRLDLAAISVTTYVDDTPPPPPPPVGDGSAPTDHASVRSVFKGSFTATPEAFQYVATVPDFHVLSMGPSKVQSIKSVNPDVEAYYYFKVGGLHGPATRPPSGDPGWDTVVAEDLLWNGPSGHPVTQTQNDWYYVDIQNPTKRAAWIQVLTEQIASVRAQGWDAVFFDNAGVIEPSLINEYPSDYSDAAYYAAVDDVMRSIRAAFPGMHIVFNSYSGWAAPGQRGLELLDHADGMFFEGFSLKVSGKYFDTARYLQNLDDFASVVASGRKAVAMDYLASADIPRRTWSLASYLLVNGPTAYHYLAGTDVDSELQQYPEDQLDIGEPTADAVVRTDGLVVRGYEGATVIVNPGTKTGQLPARKRFVPAAGAEWRWGLPQRRLGELDPVRGKHRPPRSEHSPHRPPHPVNHCLTCGVRRAEGPHRPLGAFRFPGSEGSAPGFRRGQDIPSFLDRRVKLDVRGMTEQPDSGPSSDGKMLPPLRYDSTFPQRDDS
ncbi:MAG: endo alpha-1,4 polygalactosaminidase [Deltaproteobacteria bacterium]|nr:endo alpha-1,4 polygalactosaminidase [Deltaproteobacteria bacterium]